MTCHIRWMIRRDMPEVLAISAQAVKPWSEDEFLYWLLQRNCIGMVAARGEMPAEKVVGYMIYELRKKRIHLLTMVVDEAVQREGIGKDFVLKLVSKLSFHRRTRMTADVPEDNLGAQLFLKAQGFMAVKILDDAYRFEYRFLDQEDEHLQLIAGRQEQ
jgi:ribosomal-protein-alanine N-acetyltransferase